MSTRRYTIPTAGEYLTTNTFLIAIGVVAVTLAVIYFWQESSRLDAQQKARAYQAALPNDCPDYWDIISRDPRTGVVTCRNTHLLGRCANRPDTSVYTFDDPIFTNSQTGTRAKATWAEQCGVSWIV